MHLSFFRICERSPCVNAVTTTDHLHHCQERGRRTIDLMTLVFAKLDAKTVYLSYPLFRHLAYSAYHDRQHVRAKSFTRFCVVGDVQHLHYQSMAMRSAKMTVTT